MTAVDRRRLPALGPEPSFVFPAVARRGLANGARVWTVEHRAAPVISVIVLAPGGAAEDPPGRPGLAAFTGDMLDEGAGGRSAIEVQEALARLGAMVDTEVGADATIVALTTLSRQAPAALGLLADVLLRPRFTPEDFARVRDLRLNRLIQLRDLPPSLADRAFVRALYGSHPYGHLPLGTHEGLTATCVADVADLHQRVYRPSTATIVAVGDASAEELAGLVENAFGGWVEPRAATTLPPPGAAARTAPAPSGSRLIVVDRPGAAQSEIRIGHLGVSRLDPDYHTLVVLNMILGGQFTSRLNLRLREEKGYTYGVRSSFDFRVGPGAFVVQTAVETRATVDAAAEAMAETAAIRGPRPATGEELDLARAGLTRGYPRGFETAEQVARALVQAALYGLPEDYFVTFVPSILAVDADRVTPVAARHLDPARLVAVIVGDRAVLEPALPALGLGEAVAGVTE